MPCAQFSQSPQTSKLFWTKRVVSLDHYNSFPTGPGSDRYLLTVELMVLIMKEKNVARSRSIKALDYAMSGSAGTPNCERFVDALGLKTLFAAFMNKARASGHFAETELTEID